MNNSAPPPYPGMLTIAIFGTNMASKIQVEKLILGSSDTNGMTSKDFSMKENSLFKIITTKDFFEECPYPDQRTIDFMALSHPGPQLFILAMNPENSNHQAVVVQIKKLLNVFGDSLISHLIVVLPDEDCYNSLIHLRDKNHIELAIQNENLARKCKRWCEDHYEPFRFDFHDYSERVVRIRKLDLEQKRLNGHQMWQPDAEDTDGETSVTSGATSANPNGKPRNPFNIVLLGLSGAGKSASANTILSTAKANLKDCFRSEPSSLPVTTQCEEKTIGNLYGRLVKVVDTPDFFNKGIPDSEAQIDTCKRYLREQCVILLVFQLGRMTQTENNILGKLESKFGQNISDRTIVLLTHGDDLEGSLDQFIEIHDHLKAIIHMCGHRYHLFNNKSKDSKQVKELTKKIPQYKKDKNLKYQWQCPTQ
ncbi:GTPase IMAP family member 8-like [Festucalex cinctus]